MNNEKEMFERFQSIEPPIGFDCKHCPIRKQCDTETNGLLPEQTPTCAQTLWHYITTGQFLAKLP